MASAGYQRTLPRYMQEVQGPDDGERMKAFQRLRELQSQFPNCKGRANSPSSDEVCPLLRALLLLRDLIILTVARGRRPTRGSKLGDVLHEELLQGSVQDLSGDELSQLSQSFNKIRRLGETREGFDEALRSPHMYGDEVTIEQLDMLFALYSSCSSAFPGYRSNNKQKGKSRRKREETDAEQPIEAPDAEQAIEATDAEQASDCEEGLASS